MGPPRPSRWERAWERAEEDADGEALAEPPRKRPWGGGGGRTPEFIYPSVYVSDVPAEYTEETIRELLQACGLDDEALVAVKILPSKAVDEETASCILRYADQASADAARAALQGLPVQLSSGATKHLGAREARPAKWMVDSGLAKPVEAPASRATSAALGAPPAMSSGGRPEAESCHEGLRCRGRAGMLLFEDRGSGTPYCEACWDAWEAAEAERTDKQEHEPAKRPGSSSCGLSARAAARWDKPPPAAGEGGAEPDAERRWWGPRAEAAAEAAKAEAEENEDEAGEESEGVWATPTEGWGQKWL